jgi:hypothetical protein
MAGGSNAERTAEKPIQNKIKGNTEGGSGKPMQNEMKRNMEGGPGKPMQNRMKRNMEGGPGKPMQNDMEGNMKEKQKAMQEMKKKQKKGMMRDLAILGVVSAITVILLMTFPDRKDVVLGTSWDFFVEMILILPAVMVIMGLFAVFVPRELVGKYLGNASGLKGIVIAIVLGSLPTGPLYVAFPMAHGLIKKGARTSNIIIFLSAWACIKIPQEMVELQFLGAEFMLLRLSLTVVFVIVMGISIEKLIKWSDGRAAASAEV